MIFLTSIDEYTGIDLTRHYVSYCFLSLKTSVVICAFYKLRQNKN